MTFDEKRKSPRVPVSMNVEKSDAFVTLGFGYAKNISEEGLAVDAEALVDPALLPRLGDEVRMRFKLPKSQFVITAIGKVVRVSTELTPPLFAFSFVGLLPEFRKEIRRYASTDRAA